jgi:hypothetical protein
MRYKRLNSKEQYEKNLLIAALVIAVFRLVYGEKKYNHNNNLSTKADTYRNHYLKQALAKAVDAIEKH